VVKFENFEEANAIQVDVAGIGAFLFCFRWYFVTNTYKYQ
jgi:hypothetical protein